MAVIVFLLFVLLVLGVSAYTTRKASSVGGYFVANNSVHWCVNGIAFAGGYLSTASFLGICGLIAFFGYDGFLYSIGFLAGWILALFVIAEPMKRMGTYTFTDALNSRFKHPGLQTAAGFSALIVSLCYLIPQMVGAGVLVEPLLGIPHYWGVILVGIVVILIVAGGGMTSTTYVQFFNGGLLIFFAGVLAVAVLARGITTHPEFPEEGNSELRHYSYEQKPVTLTGDLLMAASGELDITAQHTAPDPWHRSDSLTFYRLRRAIPLTRTTGNDLEALIKGRTLRIEPHNAAARGWKITEKGGVPYAVIEDWWKLETMPDGSSALVEIQSKTSQPAHRGGMLVNGAPHCVANRLRQMGRIANIPGEYGDRTGPLGPFRLLGVMADPETQVQQVVETSFTLEDGSAVTLYHTGEIAGSVFMKPGLMFPIRARPGESGLGLFTNRMNFISLMLALFLGTAALPHILIRYYTVPSADCARKSTIVAILGIGLFYILTMYMGIGSIANGAIHPETSNMSAPLLARSFGETLFAIICAIAFTTVLATVSGLIMAASGAVAHDLLGNVMKKEVCDLTKVRIGRIVGIVVGIIGIFLGIAFRGMNVSFLVGWAFAVAASANFPSIILLLFWKKTTAKGIMASIFTGTIVSIIMILLSPDMFARYGLDPASAPVPLNQPGIVSIPLSLIVLVAVSLTTQKTAREAPAG